MIILEDDLEKLMLSKKVMELSCESYQELSERLHHLQPHMQASTGCWDDTICQVERMLRRAGGCSGEEVAGGQIIKMTFYLNLFQVSVCTDRCQFWINRIFSKVVSVAALNQPTISNYNVVAQLQPLVPI